MKMKDDIYSLTPEDYVIPEYPDNEELQEKWNKLDKLISAYHLYRALAIKAGRHFGPGPVINLVSSLVQENVDRKKDKKPPIKVSASFRKQVRQWNTTHADEAKEVMDKEHIEEVEQSYERGVRPQKVTLWNMVAEEKDVDALTLSRTLQFLTSLKPIEGEDPTQFDAIINENKALLEMPSL